MKVVSFCLYGDKHHYRVGALKNVDLCKEYYPGWDIWFYVSPTIPKDILTSLKEKGAKIMVVDDVDGPFFMNYRFFPPSDSAVEYAIFRDTDSRVDEREAAAVTEWVKQGTGLHIMRDHPWHPPEPRYHMMLGGMWGVKGEKLRDVKDILLPHRIPCNHGYDQYLITQYIYPRFINDKTVHDDLFDKSPFPTPRKKIFCNAINREIETFVGCQYDAYDQPIHPDHLLILEEAIKK